MAKDGLTRKEIGWLLAQEARGAAHSLRRGFEDQLRESVLPPNFTGDASFSVGGVKKSIPSISLNAPTLDSLAALDDAMSLLGDMHRSRESVHHRGRLDVAAMLIELWPDASLSILPGGGTEVFGDTEDIRRMIELLVAQANGPQIINADSLVITVGRHDDMVQVKVELGPDAGASSAIESMWLSRLASRIGGRLTTTGRTQVLELPADGAAHERELAALRLELSQAQELGEAYARELSEMLTQSLKVEAERPRTFEVLTELEKVARQAPQRALDIISAVQMPTESQPTQNFITHLGSNDRVTVTRNQPLTDNAPVSQRCEMLTPIQQVTLKLAVKFLEQQQNSKLEFQHVSSVFGLLVTLRFDGKEDNALMIGLRALADEFKLLIEKSPSSSGKLEYKIY